MRMKLPVDDLEKQIVDTVKNNPVTIVVAETGAGKSTRIPLMVMMGLGMPVIVTQPRRLAAESLAMRVADENGLVLGGLVGYRTAVANCESPESYCVYVTDGLQLVRELTEAKKSLTNGIVLILDEVHEFNENVETLLAWCDELISQNVDIKVVIMSATMEHESLSKYFNDAPVIHVSGKTFPVSGAPSSTTLPAQVSEEELLAQIQLNVSLSKNTLVFLSGKSEISDLLQQVTEANIEAEVIQLHGDLSSDEQVRVFASYEKPKLILATNIAQTSITISDIDCVIDTGYEKRIELWNGVETLVQRCISKADARQRAGRSGRTKEGEYVLCNNTPFEKFPDYPIPEIHQKRKDQLVLRLATAGFDATLLRFFHQPEISELIESKNMLIDMEAMDTDGNVTQLGYEINRFPTSIVVARMIIEAIRRKCLTQILTFAAILSNIRSSIKLQYNKYRQYPSDFKLWDQIIPKDKQYRSDLMVEFDLWDIAYKNLNLWGQNGIDEKSYLESVDIRKRLKTMVHTIGYHSGAEYNEKADDETEVLKCVVAGMIHYVYRHHGENKYRSVGKDRWLSKDSLVHRGGYPSLLVGIPANIPMKNNGGDTEKVIAILANCTAIEVSWLMEIAPHLMNTDDRAPEWNHEKLELTIDKVTFFNGREVFRASMPVAWSEENARALAHVMATVFLSDSNEATAWVRRIREDFIKNDLRRNKQFSFGFYQAIVQYKTLQLSELKEYELTIRRILMPHTFRKKFALPIVQQNDYMSAIANYATAKKCTLEFTFEEKKVGGVTGHLATCVFISKGERYEAKGTDWISKKKLAQKEAVEAMYKKLDEIYV